MCGDVDGCVTFRDLGIGTEDLHLQTASYANEAIDAGSNLTSLFTGDIDAGLRVVPWDMGADDLLATTAVELVSFVGSGLDGGAELQWETGTELDNLGFHLYRATSVDGPYERITERPIPGLGSSPSGASYVHRDMGLTNGVTYSYELEDVDASGTTKRHGPVSATPQAGLTTDDDPTRVTFGAPDASRFRIVRKKHGLVLSLDTAGFVATAQEDGTVVLEVPGLEEMPGSSLPVKRAWVDALAGRNVKVLSVRARNVERFAGLRPSAAAVSGLEASPSGTVRARLVRRGRRLIRREGAELLDVAYQGETKKALFELSPFAWDGHALVLAKTLEVHVAFRGREVTKRSSRCKGKVALRLVARERGLYAMPLQTLREPFRLSRQGESVPFHIDNDTLYFWSEGADANPYGSEAIYELEPGLAGVRMEAAGSGDATVYWHESEHEENRYYQAGLVHARDLWLWELLLAPERKSFHFGRRFPREHTRSDSCPPSRHERRPERSRPPRTRLRQRELRRRGALGRQELS